MSRWPVVRLGELCEFLGGGTPSRKNEAYFSGQIPWVTVKDFKAHEIFDTEDHLTDEAIKDSSTRLLPADTVLLVTRVGVGKVALAKVPVTINQDIKAVIPKTEALDTNFLLRVLLSKSSELERVAVGATVKGVTLDQVRSLPIPLPPLPEQRRIVDHLNHAAGIRRLRRQALETARALIPALFVEMFGEPGRNERGWEVEPLGEMVSDVRYGTSIKCGDFSKATDLPVLRIPNIIGGEVAWIDLKYATLPNIEKLKLLLKDEDILFVRTNGNPDYIGRCAIFTGSQECLFASYLIRVRLSQKAPCKPFFVKFALSMPDYRELIIRQSKTTAGNYNINTQGLKSLPIPIPPLALQQTFAVRVADLQALISQQERHLAQADALLQSLMARYFGGAGNGMGVGAKQVSPASPGSTAVKFQTQGKADEALALPLRKKSTAELPIAVEPPPTYTPGGQAALPAANQPVPGGIPARLLAAMQPGRAYSRAELLAATGIAEADWVWAIRQLKDEGRVVQEGEKRGARYRRA